MATRFSSRFNPPSKTPHGHVRRRPPSFPNWLIAIFAAMGIVAIALIVRQILTNIEESNVTAKANDNRTWLDEAWTLNPQSDEAIQTLVTQLKDSKIRVIYVPTGAWRLDGEYRPHDYAESFRVQLKAADSNLRVLAWIWYQPSRHANEISETSLVNYARTVIDDWGYDGVQIRGFDIADGSESYARLIRAVGEITGEDHILSISAPPDHNPTDTDVPRGEGNPSISWNPRYKQRLAALVDEMVIFPFPSGLDSVADYETWVAYQVETYARDVALLDIDVKIIVALPVHGESFLHDPLIENLTTATNGARQGIQDAGDAGKRMITGAALYSHEEASPQDWLDFQANWTD